MNILITGGAGYIGTALAKRLLDEGHEVIVFDNLSNGQRNKIDNRAIFIQGDILHDQDLEQLFSTNNFDWVMHCAALKAVGESEEQPEQYFENNVIGTEKILSYMKKYYCKNIIFSSTAAVYRVNKHGIYTETDPLSPQSVYGTNKVMCEQLITQSERLGHLDQYIIFRYFNLAGDAGLEYRDPHPQNVFPLIAQSIATNKPFNIFGDDYDTVDGTGVRDYVHLIDLIDAHVLALGQQESGIFNLGTEHGTSVIELVSTFNEKLSTPLTKIVRARRPGDVAIAIADANKAQQTLGWKAQQTLHDMVDSTITVYGK